MLIVTSFSAPRDDAGPTAATTSLGGMRLVNKKRSAANPSSTLDTAASDSEEDMQIDSSPAKRRRQGPSRLGMPPAGGEPQEQVSKCIWCKFV